jgi:purine-binding chemotaxis protein CheW
MTAHDAAGAVPENYCTFVLAGLWFGVRAELVSEVHVQFPLTSIPGAPAAVRGYVNLRGQLHLVLSGRRLLLNDSDRGPADGSLVVFQSTLDEAFALEVDQAGDVVEVSSPMIDAPQPPGGSGGSESFRNVRSALISGYAKLDSCLVTLIDPRRLLWAAFEAT